MRVQGLSSVFSRVIAYKMVYNIKQVLYTISNGWGLHESITVRR